MKILSTFDTNLKNETIKKEQKKHGIDKVHLLERSWFFLLKMVILPLLCIIGLSAAISYVMFISFKRNIVAISIATSIIFILLTLSINLIQYYIDYNMDFCIITPEIVILNEQSGLFTRSIKTLDVIKIRSIYIKQHNIINSLFNNGSIIFMSDGDNKLWEIVVEYIYKPEQQKQHIQSIMTKE